MAAIAAINAFLSPVTHSITSKHTMPPPKILAGACLCGATTYTVADEFEYALNCHCAQCRRQTGAAYKPLAGIKRKTLTLTTGEILPYGEGPDAHDAHCATCFSYLYSIVRAGTYAHIAMGTMIDTPTIRPAAQIFVGSKAQWHTITDALPQYLELPPG